MKVFNDPFDNYMQSAGVPRTPIEMDSGHYSNADGFLRQIGDKLGITSPERRQLRMDEKQADIETQRAQNEILRRYAEGTLPTSGSGSSGSSKLSGGQIGLIIFSSLIVIGGVAYGIWYVKNKQN